MSVPGGFDQVTATKLYSANPAEYQVKGYLNAIGTFGGSVTSTVNFAGGNKGHVPSWDDVKGWLTNH